MVKKGMGLWVGGALVVLFATIAFLTQLNSLDARVGRDVDRLVDEFGFTKRSKESVEQPNSPTQTVAVFERQLMEAGESDEVVSVLREAFPSIEYDTYVLTQEAGSFEEGNGTVSEMHRLRLKERAAIGFYKSDLCLSTIIQTMQSLFRRSLY